MDDLVRAGLEQAGSIVLCRGAGEAVLAAEGRVGRRHPLYEDAATILACREIECNEVPI